MKIKDEFGVEREAELISDPDAPYLEYQYTVVERRYNPNYGDDRVCLCGCSYREHFDSGYRIEPRYHGYCSACPGCSNFVEKTQKQTQEQKGTCILCGGETSSVKLLVCPKCIREATM